MSSTIARNLQTVRNAIDDACKTHNRKPEHVKLLAVSKTISPERIEQAIHAGQTAFGENYLQEAVHKMDVLSRTYGNTLQWHFIGSIQSNKTAQIAQYFDWVHTVDRFKIAKRLNDQRPEHLPKLQICIQVNTDGGGNKSGVSPNEVLELAKAIYPLPRLQLRGLMHIPEPETDHTSMLAKHANLQKLLTETLALIQSSDTPESIAKPVHTSDCLDTLSMGMSADIQAAIAAGSTIVRVGSAIFGKRN